MMFCGYQYDFQNLETLTQVLVYPSIIGIIIVCFSVIIGRHVNTLVFTLFFLSVILIRYIYLHKNSKFMFKVTVFEYDSFYIELCFLGYYTFLYSQQSQDYQCRQQSQDYQCICDIYFNRYSIFEYFTFQKLPIYILTYLLSFKYSFKIFECEYLVANLVIVACYFWFDIDKSNKYEYMKNLFYTLGVSNFFSVLISIWTFSLTFFLTILFASTSGYLISLISFSSFLLWFLKYENSICEFIPYGVCATDWILFPLFLLISLIIKLGF